MTLEVGVSYIFGSAAGRVQWAGLGCLLDLLSPAERSTTVPALTFVILYVLLFAMVSLVARIDLGRTEANTRGRASRKKRQRVKIMIGEEKKKGSREERQGGTDSAYVGDLTYIPSEQ
jgi:hypothetical protein